MDTRKPLPLSCFSVIIDPSSTSHHDPAPTVFETGRVALNVRAAAKIGQRQLILKLIKDGFTLCLEEAEGGDSLFCFPKSGSKKMPYAAAFLREKNIGFPARYLLTEYDPSDRCWQGFLQENPTKQPGGRRRNTKKSSER